MTIGKKIKHLRQQKNITQEKLAQHLNISSQSVSKWETGTALPDISQIIPLANFFNISIDELFDRNYENQEEEISRCEKRCSELLEKDHSIDNINQCILTWREMLKKYPDDYRCCFLLAIALTNRLGFSAEKKEEMQNSIQEIISLCEKTSKECSDNKLRNDAIDLLVALYSSPHLPCYSEEKAVKYAEASTSIFSCKEFLLERMYTRIFYNKGDKESKNTYMKVRHTNIIIFMTTLIHSILNNPYDTVEDHIFARESAIKIWNDLIYDGNFLSVHIQMRKLHMSTARLYAEQKNREKALYHLRMAKKHARDFDKLPPGQHNFTSIMVKSASAEEAYPVYAAKYKSGNPYTESEEQMFYNEFANDLYDFVREEFCQETS